MRQFEIIRCIGLGYRKIPFLLSHIDHDLLFHNVKKSGLNEKRNFYYDFKNCNVYFLILLEKEQNKSKLY